MQKRIILLFLFIIFLGALVYGQINSGTTNNWKGRNIEVDFKTELPAATQLSPTPTPTPKPLTFSEMNQLYGPCVYLPVLMYHYVQDIKTAQKNAQTGQTVQTKNFREQLEYLKNKGYNSLQFSDLISFFENGTTLPSKSFLLTFDDGYEDFYINALPILKEFGYKASVFLSTGLVNNPGYLSWQQISDSQGSGIYYANHTWSHKNVLAKPDLVEKEITLADAQLTEHGLNQSKVFAYPYGSSNNFSEELLMKIGYHLAFTTRYGSVLCIKQRYQLPRIRVGNASLATYGL